MALLLKLRRYRGAGALVVTAFLAADIAIALAACSTSSPDATGTDATTETSAPPDGGKDGPGPKPDGGTEGGGGACSPANDKCDLVLQNCPAGQQCLAFNGKKSECRAVTATQQLPKGRACCPSTNVDENPCLPGLHCIGNACVDGGAPSGRCSPACCKGDNSICGKSDPEGISGACDITLVDPTTSVPQYDVCTYAQTCKPFKVQPCAVGQTCIVEDKAGTASCVDVSGGGKTNRQPCSFANECNDGLICLGNGDGGTCHFVCLLPGSTHPFDAGVEKGGPGLGGCAAGEKCDLLIKDTPSWFAACSLDGG